MWKVKSWLPLTCILAFGWRNPRKSKRPFATQISVLRFESGSPRNRTSTSLHHEIREFLLVSPSKFCFQKKAVEKIGGGGDEALILCSVDRTSLYNLVNRTNLVQKCSYYVYCFSLHVSDNHVPIIDRLCGLVVRVSGYRYRGLGFDSRRYQIF